MTRHKSRVARIRRARRGTRKQSGGFSLSSLNPFNLLNWGKNPEEKDDSPAVAANNTSWWENLNPLKYLSNNNNNKYNSVGPKTPAPHPPAVDEDNKGLFSHSGDNKAHAPQTQPPPTAPLAQGGGRKTRHRRRRSPRHHRK